MGSLEFNSAKPVPTAFYPAEARRCRDRKTENPIHPRNPLASAFTSPTLRGSGGDPLHLECSVLGFLGLQMQEGEPWESGVITIKRHESRAGRERHRCQPCIRESRCRKPLLRGPFVHGLLG